MTDEEYIFKQDVREKAITARSSHKVGSARRRKCSFSTDHMTKKEWEKMNGPVYRITPGEAMPWASFKALPETLQKKYIECILEKYKVGPNAIARMFGISKPYCGERLRKLGFTFSGHTTPSETERFLTDYKLAQVKAPAAGKKNTEFETGSVQPAVALTRSSLTFAGPFSPEEIMQKLALLFDPGQDVAVTIEVEAH